MLSGISKKFISTRAMASGRDGQAKLRSENGRKQGANYDRMEVQDYRLREIFSATTEISFRIWSFSAAVHL